MRSIFKIMIGATIASSFCLHSMACNIPTSSPDSEKVTCSFSENEYLCEIDVYDPETNEVQTYYDITVKIKECTVTYIIDDAYGLDEIVLFTTRTVSDKDSDAQAEGDDGKTYNFYNIRLPEL